MKTHAHIPVRGYPFIKSADLDIQEGGVPNLGAAGISEAIDVSQPPDNELGKFIQELREQWKTRPSEKATFADFYASFMENIHKYGKRTTDLIPAPTTTGFYASDPSETEFARFFARSVGHEITPIWMPVTPLLNRDEHGNTRLVILEESRSEPVGDKDPLTLGTEFVANVDDINNTIQALKNTVQSDTWIDDETKSRLERLFARWDEEYERLESYKNLFGSITLPTTGLVEAGNEVKKRRVELSVPTSTMAYGNAEQAIQSALDNLKMVNDFYEHIENVENDYFIRKFERYYTDVVGSTIQGAVSDNLDAYLSFIARIADTAKLYATEDSTDIFPAILRFSWGLPLGVRYKYALALSELAKEAINRPKSQETEDNNKTQIESKMGEVSSTLASYRHGNIYPGKISGFLGVFYLLGSYGTGKTSFLKNIIDWVADAAVGVADQINSTNLPMESPHASFHIGAFNVAISRELLQKVSAWVESVKNRITQLGQGTNLDTTKLVEYIENTFKLSRTRTNDAAAQAFFMRVANALVCKKPGKNAILEIPSDKLDKILQEISDIVDRLGQHTHEPTPNGYTEDGIAKHQTPPPSIHAPIEFRFVYRADSAPSPLDVLVWDAIREEQGLDPKANDDDAFQAALERSPWRTMLFVSPMKLEGDRFVFDLEKYHIVKQYITEGLDELLEKRTGKDFSGLLGDLLEQEQETDARRRNARRRKQRTDADLQEQRAWLIGFVRLVGIHLYLGMATRFAGLVELAGERKVANKKANSVNQSPADLAKEIRQLTLYDLLESWKHRVEELEGANEIENFAQNDGLIILLEHLRRNHYLRDNSQLDEIARVLDSIFLHIALRQAFQVLGNALIGISKNRRTNLGIDSLLASKLFAFASGMDKSLIGRVLQMDKPELLWVELVNEAQSTGVIDWWFKNNLSLAQFNMMIQTLTEINHASSKNMVVKQQAGAKDFYGLGDIETNPINRGPIQGFFPSGHTLRLTEFAIVDEMQDTSYPHLLQLMGLNASVRTYNRLLGKEPAFWTIYNGLFIAMGDPKQRVNAHAGGNFLHAIVDNYYLAKLLEEEYLKPINQKVSEFRSTDIVRGARRIRNRRNLTYNEPGLPPRLPLWNTPLRQEAIDETDDEAIYTAQQLSRFISEGGRAGAVIQEGNRHVQFATRLPLGNNNIVERILDIYTRKEFVETFLNRLIARELIASLSVPGSGGEPTGPISSGEPTRHTNEDYKRYLDYRIIISSENDIPIYVKVLKNKSKGQPSGQGTQRWETIGAIDLERIPNNLEEFSAFLALVQEAIQNDIEQRINAIERTLPGEVSQESIQESIKLAKNPVVVVSIEIDQEGQFKEALSKSGFLWVEWLINAIAHVVFPVFHIEPTGIQEGRDSPVRYAKPTGQLVIVLDDFSDGRSTGSAERSARSDAAAGVEEEDEDYWLDDWDDIWSYEEASQRRDARVSPLETVYRRVIEDLARQYRIVAELLNRSEKQTDMFSGHHASYRSLYAAAGQYALIRLGEYREGIEKELFSRNWYMKLPVLGTVTNAEEHLWAFLAPTVYRLMRTRAKKRNRMIKPLFLPGIANNVHAGLKGLTLPYYMMLYPHVKRIQDAVSAGRTPPAHEGVLGSRQKTIDVSDDEKIVFIGRPTFLILGYPSRGSKEAAYQLVRDEIPLSLASGDQLTLYGLIPTVPEPSAGVGQAQKPVAVQMQQPTAAPQAAAQQPTAPMQTAAQQPTATPQAGAQQPTAPTQQELLGCEPGNSLYPRLLSTDESIWERLHRILVNKYGGSINYAIDLYARVLSNSPIKLPFMDRKAIPRHFTKLADFSSLIIMFLTNTSREREGKIWKLAGLLPSTLNKLFKRWWNETEKSRRYRVLARNLIRSQLFRLPPGKYRIRIQHLVRHAVSSTEPIRIESAQWRRGSEIVPATQDADLYLLETSDITIFKGEDDFEKINPFTELIGDNPMTEHINAALRELLDTTPYVVFPVDSKVYHPFSPARLGEVIAAFLRTNPQPGSQASYTINILDPRFVQQNRIAFSFRYTVKLDRKGNLAIRVGKKTNPGSHLRRNERPIWRSPLGEQEPRFEDVVVPNEIVDFVRATDLLFKDENDNDLDPQVIGQILELTTIGEPTRIIIDPLQLHLESVALENERTSSGDEDEESPSAFALARGGLELKKLLKLIDEYIELKMGTGLIEGYPSTEDEIGRTRLGQVIRAAHETASALFREYYDYIGERFTAAIRSLVPVIPSKSHIENLGDLSRSVRTVELLSQEPRTVHSLTIGAPAHILIVSHGFEEHLKFAINQLWDRLPPKRKSLLSQDDAAKAVDDALGKTGRSVFLISADALEKATQKLVDALSQKGNQPLSGWVSAIAEALWDFKSDRQGKESPALLWLRAIRILLNTNELNERLHEKGLDRTYGLIPFPLLVTYLGAQLGQQPTIQDAIMNYLYRAEMEYSTKGMIPPLDKTIVDIAESAGLQWIVHTINLYRYVLMALAGLNEIYPFVGLFTRHPPVFDTSSLPALFHPTIGLGFEVPIPILVALNGDADGDHGLVTLLNKFENLSEYETAVAETSEYTMMLAGRNPIETRAEGFHNITPFAEGYGANLSHKLLMYGYTLPVLDKIIRKVAGANIQWDPSKPNEIRINYSGQTHELLFMINDGYGPIALSADPSAWVSQSLGTWLWQQVSNDRREIISWLRTPVEFVWKNKTYIAPLCVVWNLALLLGPDASQSLRDAVLDLALQKRWIKAKRSKVGWQPFRREDWYELEDAIQQAGIDTRLAITLFYARGDIPGNLPPLPSADPEDIIKRSATEEQLAKLLPKGKTEDAMIPLRIIQKREVSFGRRRKATPSSEIPLLLGLFSVLGSVAYAAGIMADRDVIIGLDKRVATPEEKDTLIRHMIVRQLGTYLLTKFQTGSDGKEYIYFIFPTARKKKDDVYTTYAIRVSADEETDMQDALVRLGLYLLSQKDEHHDLTSWTPHFEICQVDVKIAKSKSAVSVVNVNPLGKSYFGSFAGIMKKSIGVQVSDAPILDGSWLENVRNGLSNLGKVPAEYRSLIWLIATSGYGGYAGITRWQYQQALSAAIEAGEANPFIYALLQNPFYSSTFNNKRLAPTVESCILFRDGIGYMAANYEFINIAPPGSAGKAAGFVDLAGLLLKYDARREYRHPHGGSHPADVENPSVVAKTVDNAMPRTRSNAQSRDKQRTFTIELESDDPDYIRRRIMQNMNAIGQVRSAKLELHGPGMQNPVKTINNRDLIPGDYQPFRELLSGINPQQGWKIKITGYLPVDNMHDDSSVVPDRGFVNPVTGKNLDDGQTIQPSSRQKAQEGIDLFKRPNPDGNTSADPAPLPSSYLEMPVSIHEKTPPDLITIPLATGIYDQISSLGTSVGLPVLGRDFPVAPGRNADPLIIFPGQGTTTLATGFTPQQLGKYLQPLYIGRRKVDEQSNSNPTQRLGAKLLKKIDLNNAVVIAITMDAIRRLGGFAKVNDILQYIIQNSQDDNSPLKGVEKAVLIVLNGK
ncbi:MAG: hypothetical protein QW570_06760, partial [Candidatus Caldarchaeum sp.]